MAKPLTRMNAALQWVMTPLLSVVDISNSLPGKSYLLLLTGKLTRMGVPLAG